MIGLPRILMLRKQSVAALPKHSSAAVGFGSVVPTDRDCATEASKLDAFALPVLKVPGNAGVKVCDGLKNNIGFARIGAGDADFRGTGTSGRTNLHERS
jgi:hypothetical protein